MSSRRSTDEQLEEARRAILRATRKVQRVLKSHGHSRALAAARDGWLGEVERLVTRESKTNPRPERSAADLVAWAGGRAR